MKRKARLTYHAFGRTLERVSISVDAVTRIIKKGLATPIKHGSGPQQSHLLFYSPKDRRHFIAVQENRTGKIITIMPHNSVSSQHTSNSLVGSAWVSNLEETLRKAGAHQTSVVNAQQGTYFLRFCFRGDRNNRLRTVTMEIPAYKYPRGYEQIQSDSKLQNTLLQFAMENRRRSERFDCLLFSLGKRGRQKVMTLSI